MSWPGVVLVAAVMPLGALWSRRLYAPCDDAYIFLVYARNLAEGRGLTFNGIEVEGYSSQLWMALLALGGLVGLPLPGLAEWLSLASGALAVAATFVLGRRAGLDPWRALLPAALLALTGDFAFYASVGLETALFTACLAACTALAVGALRESATASLALLRSYHFPVWMGLMVLARPEGALFAGLLLVGLLWRTRDWAATLRCGLVLSALLAPFFLGRRLHYGYWFPNTYYAKAGAGLANLGHGVGYLVAALPRYAPLLVACAAAFWPGWRRRDPGLALLAAIPPVWLAVVAVQGGDNMVGGRALVPVLPLVFVALAAASASLPLRGVAPAAALLAGALVWTWANDGPTQRHAERWRKHFPIRRAAGEYLRDHFPPGTLVALSPAGIIPYFSRLPTLDMLGLNNEHIAHHGRKDRSQGYAHQAGDGAYVLSREPGVILFGGHLSREPNNRVSSQEIWESPEFRSRYEPVEWPGIGHAYVRRDR